MNNLIFSKLGQKGLNISLGLNNIWVTTNLDLSSFHSQQYISLAQISTQNISITYQQLDHVSKRIEILCH